MAIATGKMLTIDIHESGNRAVELLTPSRKAMEIMPTCPHAPQAAPKERRFVRTPAVPKLSTPTFLALSLPEFLRL